MTLTGKQIESLGIVTNLTKKCIQQQGVDVQIERIKQMEPNQLRKVGLVPKDGKTMIPKYSEIPIENSNGIMHWTLMPGWYEVDLMQGCDMKDKYKGEFKTRSSLVRCGALVHSGQFDAGFTTEQMGCFLQVIQPIDIERGARIAQFVVEKTDVVENTYDGQWQNDKQRK